MDDTISFDDAWKPKGARYPVLCMLFGELATVFPLRAQWSPIFLLLDSINMTIDSL